jgi:hypothetical protein
LNFLGTFLKRVVLVGRKQNTMTALSWRHTDYVSGVAHRTPAA